ncbi:MAG: Flp pilus assembly protein CpaB [Alphaproteobacteria bacterium]|nr:Flp pilus assembly protein CpaB [Alphaproteobacteria bacterium]
MSRSKLLLIICAFLAAFVVITIRNRLSSPPAETPVAADVVSKRVMVARHEITPGNFVQGAQDLEWQDAPEGVPTENLLREGVVRLEEFNGAVVRRPLKAGEVVPASALMKAGDGGFMSAVLEPGMRAVSVAVTATSGNAGFITPGDRVDLIVTHRVRVPMGKDSANMEDSVVSETFVRDVRVLAVDQMLDNPENKAILAKTITVEVTARQAEQVSVAAEMGKVTFTLRSIANAVAKIDGNKPAQTPQEAKAQTIKDLYDDVTRDSDISSVLDRGGPISMQVHVIRGDQTENLQFNRGAK